MKFHKAERKAAKMRLALLGPSGSGKTYSSLLIAAGLGQRIAMIDTERGSGELYSGLVDYDVAQLTPPFEPEKYIDAIRSAEAEGYDVIIVDSLSHAWAGEGGILDIQDRVAKVTRNSFTAWREVTPQHNALVDALLQSPCHVIVTMRTKTHYDMVKDSDGRVKPVKIGLAPIQRDGLEYEFTVVMDISIDGHIATATKDRTGIFDGRYFTPSRENGRSLVRWLNSGNQASDKPADPDKFQTIEDLMDSLDLGNLRDSYYPYVMEKYGLMAYERIQPAQIDEQIALLRQCKRSKTKHRQLIDILNGQQLAA